MKVKATRGIVVVVLISLLFVPVGTSSLAYYDSTEPSNLTKSSKVVVLNPNQSMMAVGLDNIVAIYDTTNLSKIAQFSTAYAVTSMAFNPNGTILAVGHVTPSSDLIGSIRTFDMEKLETIDGNLQGRIYPTLLSWSPDGMTLISEEKNGGILLGNSTLMQGEQIITSPHTSDLSCLEYSPGGDYIISGTDQGYFTLRNETAHPVGEHNKLTNSNSVLDCHFSLSDETYFILSEDGELLRYNFIDNSSKSYGIFAGAAKIHISNDDSSSIYLSVIGDNPKVMKIDLETEISSTEIEFFHSVLDYQIILDTYNRIDQLFVVTGTDQVVVYRQNVLDPSTGKPGADIDGDRIPDSDDMDDDGDGIPDIFDINCQSNLPCSTVPDLERIRKINIVVSENELIIEDHLKLPSDVSTDIRNHSRIGLKDDGKISKSEVTLFSETLCNSINHEDLILFWKDSFDISSGSLENATVSCRIADGMLVWDDKDFSTPLHIVVAVTYDLTSSPTFPLDFTLSGQSSAPLGTLLWMAPHHPILVTGTGDLVTEFSLPTWYIQMEEVSGTFEEKQEAQPSIYDEIISKLSHPLVIASTLAFLIILVVLWMRKSNSIDMSLINSQECQVCETINPSDALNCSNCGALFVFDNVMDKIYEYMVNNAYTVHALFNKFDVDSSGTLESDELLKGLRSLRIADLPLKQLRALITSIDVDGNGVIDLEEFEMALDEVQKRLDKQDQEEEVVEYEEESEDSEIYTQEDVNEAPAIVSKKKIIRPTGENVSKVAKKRVKAVIQTSTGVAPVRKKRAVKKPEQEHKAGTSEAKKRTVKRRKVSNDD